MAASDAIGETLRYFSMLKAFVTAAQIPIGKTSVNFDSLIERLKIVQENLLKEGVLTSASCAVKLITELQNSLNPTETALINEKGNLLNNTKEQKQLLEDLSNAQEIYLTQPWKRAKYKDLVKNKVRELTREKVVDWFALSPDERRRVAIEDLNLAGDIAKGYEDFEVTGAVFGKLVEPTLIQPTFVTHLPKELVPLAKLSPDDPTTVEVFECCISGQEISPGYTEQNDPIAQRTTLEHQAGGEQQKLDEDFLIALEHGMPPAGGIGIGIDRLCVMLLGQESIRDVILFPQLKPK
jgi:lysyl-tRNA synthetase class 2